MGKPRAARHQLGGRGGVALLGEVGVVEVGEHGHGEDAQLGAALAGHGRAEASCCRGRAR